LTKEPSRKRTYDSPLRRQQQGMTTEAIMAAVEQLILEGRIHNFTIQQVAKLAGISYASVYRHFSSRESLVRGYRDWIMEHLPPEPYVDDLNDLPEWVEQTVPIFFKSLPRAKAVLAALSALQNTDVHPHSRGRDEWIVQLVKKAAPDVPDDIRNATGSVIRLLVSMSSWVEFHTRYGLDESALILTVSNGIQAQIEYLKSAAR
jgi:AcrR family transcriptional regulator